MFVVLFWAPAAEAGGYYLSDSGIVGAGRAGAWVAGANTQFAQHYNPAGLIRIEAPAIRLGMSAVTQNVTFERACPPPPASIEPCTTPGETHYDEVHNEAPPLPIPEIGFAMPIGDRVGFAFGFYSPFAPGVSYPEDGPQRYTAKDISIYQFTVGPSVAVRVHDMLTLGLGLQWQFLRLDSRLDVTVGGQDNLKGDVASEIQATDSFTPNLNGGLLFEPVDEVSIGLSFQPSTKFVAHGPLAIDFAGSDYAQLLNETSYGDDEITLGLTLPWVVRGGVAVRPIPKLEIEAAAVWQDWSVLDEIAVSDVLIVLDGHSDEVPDQIDQDIALPASLNDSISLRLGGEGRVADDAVAIRGGVGWEASSLTPQRVSVQLVDTSKVQLAAGGSLFLVDQRLRIDGLFSWLFLQSLEVTDSEVTQIDSGVDDITPLVVGNGNYASHAWIVGLGVEWMFRSPEQ